MWPGSKMDREINILINEMHDHWASVEQHTGQIEIAKRIETLVGKRSVIGQCPKCPFGIRGRAALSPEKVHIGIVEPMIAIPCERNMPRDQDVRNRWRPERNGCLGKIRCRPGPYRRRGVRRTIGNGHAHKNAHF